MKSVRTLFALLVGAAVFWGSPLTLAAPPGNKAEKTDKLIPKPRPADDETLRPHAGILLGVADPNGPPDIAFAYGIDIGIQPYIPFSVGLQLSRFQSGDSEKATDHGLTRMSLLPKLAYNFGGDIDFVRSSYVGGKAGLVFDEMYRETNTRFAIGPMFGFDYPIVPHWTVGLELAYLGVIGPNSPDSPSLNAAVKYWF